MAGVRAVEIPARGRERHGLQLLHLSYEPFTSPGWNLHGPHPGHGCCYHYSPLDRTGTVVVSCPTAEVDASQAAWATFACAATRSRAVVRMTTLYWGATAMLGLGKNVGFSRGCIKKKKRNE